MPKCLFTIIAVCNMSDESTFLIVDLTGKQFYSDITSLSPDAGIDLKFPDSILLDVKATATIVDLKIKVRNVKNGKFMPFLVLPRSSISKTPLSLANSIGLIDKNYQGNIKVAIRNNGSHPYQITEGEALFQIVTAGLDSAYVSVVDISHEAFSVVTTRGDGGFGSTGVGGTNTVKQS